MKTYDYAVSNCFIIHSLQSTEHVTTKFTYTEKPFVDYIHTEKTFSHFAFPGVLMAYHWSNNVKTLKDIEIHITLLIKVVHSETFFEVSVLFSISHLQGFAEREVLTLKHCYRHCSFKQEVILKVNH